MIKIRKIIIALVIILIAILGVGLNYQRSNSYNKDEIEKVNNDMISEIATLADEQTNETTQQPQQPNNTTPKIEITYPSSFKDRDTIETDKVQLKFSDDSKVTKATLNGMTVSTQEIRITTEGTYKVEIQDDKENSTSLTFTIKFPEETNQNQQSTPTTQKTKTNNPKPKDTKPPVNNPKTPVITGQGESQEENKEQEETNEQETNEQETNEQEEEIENPPTNEEATQGE